MTGSNGRFIGGGKGRQVRRKGVAEVVKCESGSLILHSVFV